MSSYVVEPMPLISFLNEPNIKLPRFQRRSAWNKKQNFELCISVFQEYPVGVVILNEEYTQGQSTSWLLDGRQRRSALMTMRDNPVELYEWAKKYIKFNAKTDEESVRRAYWEKVTKYLEREEDFQEEEQDTDEAGLEVEDEEGLEVAEPELSFDKKSQERGLKTLIDLILMVHQIDKNKASKWERTFNFLAHCPRLPYFEKTTKKFKPTKLRNFILTFCKNLQNTFNSDNFYAYLAEEVDINNEIALKNQITLNWESIEQSIRTINASEEIFNAARIGVIKLKNATPLDAQNIFTRINSGGTQLKSEELLSAKPYWNKVVSTYNPQLRQEVKQMYNNLDIPVPENIVRWDIAATLVSRISDGGLIFDSLSPSTESKLISDITLGFKIISGHFLGGISKKSVTDLENSTIFKSKGIKEISWPDDVEDFITELNIIVKILLEDNFFKCLSSWGAPLLKLLSVATALEFITIIWNDWERLNKPTICGSGDAKALQRDARILFDRLVLEYAKGIWKGSSDSRMSNDVKNWQNRLVKVDKSEWIDFITHACQGVYNGIKTNEDVLRSVLYYAHAIQMHRPHSIMGITFDVDHIIPRERFKANSTIPEHFENSLANLSLLPTKDNISKKAKCLNEITDEWLQEQIVHYSGISKDKFELYSDISNWTLLMEDRTSLFVQIFSTMRDTILDN